MNRLKALAIFLIIIDAALLAICGFYYINRDSSAPKIEFAPSDIEYNSEIDKNLLLESVIAVDAEDGDISERIVIEKIIEDEENSVAVVYYAVCDYAGNVAKASRQFTAKYNDKENIASQLSQPQPIDVTILDDVSINNNGEANEQKQTVLDADEDALVKTDDEKSQIEKVENAEKEKTEKAEKEKAEKAEKEKAEKAEKEKPQEILQEEAVPVNDKAPKIVVTANDFTTPIGTKLALTQVILGLYDDKDDYGYLFNKIEMSKYDYNQKGDYNVSIKTTDSDKNVSNTVTVTVHVI